jgi:uncharacterized protein YwqG
MPSLPELQQKLTAVLAHAELSRLAQPILAAAQPAVLVELLPVSQGDLPLGASKIGGDPDLPAGYPWPAWKDQPQGFLAQFDLSAASACDLQGLLPRDGLLSFFYDLVDTPWGYDPAQQGYSHIAYFPAGTPLSRRESPDKEILLPCSPVIFSPALTIPVMGSQAYDQLVDKAKLKKDEVDRYWDLPGEVRAAYCQIDSETFHQLLGHANNVQDDMQLEAELVTNGLYCGDQTGYRDRRRKNLEKQSHHWQLLFQLDSVEALGMMWGDMGRLYYWVKRDDLHQRQFGGHWMTMQCG